MRSSRDSIASSILPSWTQDRRDLQLARHRLPACGTDTTEYELFWSNDTGNSKDAVKLYAFHCTRCICSREKQVQELQQRKRTDGMRRIHCDYKVLLRPQITYDSPPRKICKKTSLN